MKTAKAVVAGIGSTLTALSTALATVSLAIGDDAISAEEIGSLATTAVLLVGTIWSVWRVPNRDSATEDIVRSARTR